jgi:hypothetical protein
MKRRAAWAAANPREQYIGDFEIGPKGRTIPMFTELGLSPQDQALVKTLTEEALRDAIRKADDANG